MLEVTSEAQAKKGDVCGMSDQLVAEVYWRKAVESLAGAQSECASARYSNCANRAYYAAFQAAISTLLQNGIRHPAGRWPHTFVQSEFVGKLINRRRSFPSELRGTLAELQSVRHRADYGGAMIARSDAARSLSQSQKFIDAVAERGGWQ